MIRSKSVLQAPAFPIYRLDDLLSDVFKTSNYQLINGAELN